MMKKKKEQILVLCVIAVMSFLLSFLVPQGVLAEDVPEPVDFTDAREVGNAKWIKPGTTPIEYSVYLNDTGYFLAANSNVPARGPAYIELNQAYKTRMDNILGDSGSVYDPGLNVYYYFSLEYPAEVTIYGQCSTATNSSLSIEKIDNIETFMPSTEPFGVMLGADEVKSISTCLSEGDYLVSLYWGQGRPDKAGEKHSYIKVVADYSINHEDDAEWYETFPNKHKHDEAISRDCKYVCTPYQIGKTLNGVTSVGNITRTTEYYGGCYSFSISEKTQLVFEGLTNINNAYVFSQNGGHKFSDNDITKMGNTMLLEPGDYILEVFAKSKGTYSFKTSTSSESTSPEGAIAGVDISPEGISGWSVSGETVTINNLNVNAEGYAEVCIWSGDKYNKDNFGYGKGLAKLVIKGDCYIKKLVIDCPVEVTCESDAKLVVGELEVNTTDGANGKLTYSDGTTYDATIKTFESSHAHTEPDHQHIWDVNYTVDTAPTCEKTGSKSIHCTNCDEKKNITVIEALGHLWDDGVVTKKPTYTEKGVKTFKCTRSGCTETKTEEIAVLEKGSESDSGQEEDPSHEHVWDEGVVTKEPTYTEKGIKTYTCKDDSSHIKTVEIPTLEKLGDVIAEDSDVFTDADLSSDKIKLVGIRDTVYTGSNVTFDVRVYKGTRLLIEGTDYTLKYTNNKEACIDLTSSTAPTVTFIGKGIYKNEVVEPAKFKINPVDISNLKASNDTVVLGNKTYKPVPALTVNGKKLKANKDYEVIYDDAHKDGFAEVGTYTITLKGINNYTGNVTSIFKVVDAKQYILMSKASVSGYEKSFKYDGTAKTQDPAKLTVKIGSDSLTLNTDYTVECINNTEAGIASMIIKAAEGSDKYAGEKVITYKILGTPVSKAKVTIGSKDFDTKNIFYTGKTIKPPVSLELKDGTKLTEGTDYTITYQKNVNVGTAAIIIEGQGAYSGTVKKTFKIKPVVLTNNKKIKAETVGKATKNDKGKYEIEVSVKYNEKPLIKGSDYVIGFKNNTKPGTATVTIKGKGNYTKTTIVTFEITE